MENIFVPVKLFSLALVMALTNFQAKFLKFSYLTDMLRQEDKEADLFLTDANKQNISGFRKFWNHAKCYFIFGAIRVLRPLPVLLLVIYTLR